MDNKYNGMFFETKDEATAYMKEHGGRMFVNDPNDASFDLYIKETYAFLETNLVPVTYFQTHPYVIVE